MSNPVVTLLFRSLNGEPSCSKPQTEVTISFRDPRGKLLYFERFGKLKKGNKGKEKPKKREKIRSLFREKGGDA